MHARGNAGVGGVHTRGARTQGVTGEVIPTQAVGQHQELPTEGGQLIEYAINLALQREDRVRNTTQQEQAPPYGRREGAVRKAR